MAININAPDMRDGSRTTGEFMAKEQVKTDALNARPDVIGKKLILKALLDTLPYEEFLEAQVEVLALD